MNEKKYEKKIEFQKKMIARQAEQIESLKSQIEELKKKCDEKDDIINSVSSLRNELISNVEAAKEYKEQYKSLVEEVKKMKDVMNQTVYKNKWKLVRFLIK